MSIWDKFSKTQEGNDGSLYTAILNSNVFSTTPEDKEIKLLKKEKEKLENQKLNLKEEVLKLKKEVAEYKKEKDDLESEKDKTARESELGFVKEYLERCKVSKEYLKINSHILIRSCFVRLYCRKNDNNTFTVLCDFKRIGRDSRDWEEIVVLPALKFRSNARFFSDSMMDKLINASEDIKEKD